MRIYGLLMFLICVFALGSCARGRTSRTTIYEDRRTGVTLRKVVSHEATLSETLYSHPIVFEVGDLKYLLKSIRYREKGLLGWSDLERVFSADELYRFTPHLVEAFLRAEPDEQVLFRLTTSKKGALFSSERFTNGRMFVKDKKLHCLFANVDVRPDVANIYDGDPRNYYAGLYWRLEPGEWQRLVQGERGIHYNWIELDWKRGLEGKMRREQAAQERAERRRAIKVKQEKTEVGWEDWEPEEQPDDEEAYQEEDVYFAPPP